MALYRRAAVRRAAVDRYLLLTAKFDAVAHVGTDRRTDTLPFYKPCPFFTLLPQESKRIDKISEQSIGASQLHSLCYFTRPKHFTLLWAYGGLAPLAPDKLRPCREGTGYVESGQNVNAGRVFQLQWT